jgi:hypothetical protein
LIRSRGVYSRSVPAPRMGLRRSIGNGPRWVAVHPRWLWLCGHCLFLLLGVLCALVSLFFLGVVIESCCAPSCVGLRSALVVTMLCFCWPAQRPGFLRTSASGVWCGGAQEGRRCPI